MDVPLGWGSSLSRASHDAVQIHDPMDAAVAVMLLFGVVTLPPLVGIRTMYTNCWFVFTAVAHVLASESALGIATSMGITIMVGWYSLRVFDRYAFTAILNGWLGVWTSSPVLGVAARVGDFVLHLLVPMLLVSCYLPLVRVWMSVPALVSSRLWSHFVVGGGLFPKADHIYRFSPPRSQRFWNAAYKMELMLNVLVPLFCVLAHQRSFWVYAATAIAGAVLFCLQLIRSLLLPKLRKNAKTIMCRLLSSGGIRPNVDFVVRNDSFWLDWMSEGLVAIGESYVGSLWATSSARTLDDLVAGFLTIPMEGRQDMYRSWSARFVALAARLFNYPPSSMGLVVGAVSEQFDLCPEFRQAYMDRYLHQGFGMWTPGTTTIHVAQSNKLASLDRLLDIRAGHTVLDISIGSWGGVGCYLAQQHPVATVVCVLSSIQELARAKKFARELDVFSRMEFVLTETPEQLLSLLGGYRTSKFDRITLCGVIETVPDTQRTRLLQALKHMQTANGTTLLELSVCTAANMTTHAWTNKYVHSAFPCYAITLPRMRRLARETGFTLHDTLGYSEHYERTFLEWNRRFQAQWGHDAAPRSLGQAAATDPTSPLQQMPSLPESFKRTWEFYLLHAAACYRSGALQVFQRLSRGTLMATVDWEKHVDEASGSTYYYNTRTGESSWDVPSDVSTLQEPMASEERPSPKWREFVDDASGATYYHDEVHGVSQWDKPEADITLDNKSDKIDKNPTNLATLKSIEKPKNDEDNYDLIVLDPELPVEIQDEDVDCNDTEEAKQVQEEHRDEDQGEDGASVVSSDGSAEGTAREAEKEKEDGQGPAGPWVKYVDAASGKPYYLNASTGTTQWDQPEGVEESQPAARLSSDHPVSAEYRSHLNRMHTERLARVTQQVLDPSGHLSRLNSILSSIDSKASAAVSGMNEEPADAPQTAKAEWQQHVDAQTQRYYYHNVVTGVTQWTKPDAPIVSGLASWVPPKLPDPESTVAGHKTVSGVNYAARAKFNRLTGKYEQLGGDEYWQNAGIAADRAGRQMSHFFDMTELEKNREEARRRKEQLKRKNIDWKKISAEKKAKKQKQRNEWLFTD